ncbi:MAG: hypothetical protein K2G02_08485 [Phocaeicola sp.]|nr:hypothetical protein [Phocaeicola sp.]MDE6181131.1 hypothetical protein [Phocaeicola sp.]
MQGGWHRYKEGVMTGVALVAVGGVLQAVVGRIDWSRAAFPVNLLLLVLFLAGLGGMHTFRSKVGLFDRLGRLPASVSALGWVMGVTVLMGCIRQTPSHLLSDGVEVWPDFSRMLSSWSFVLLYVWMTVVLGLVILRRIYPFRWSKIPFLLHHVGLFVVMVTATLGSSDRKCLRMTLVLGELGRFAWSETDRRSVELPWTVELKEFVLDEYPPVLVLMDKETGKALPAEAPLRWVLEAGVEQGGFTDWDLKIVRSIPEAVPVAEEGRLDFVASRSVGAVYAVCLEAVHRKTKVRKEGWVSGGSFMFLGELLELDEHVCVAMMDREPRRFASRVVLNGGNGVRKEGVMEVNRPLEQDGWGMYLLGYDNAKGRWSDGCVVGLVYDPWQPYIYAGILFMMAGAVCLFVMAQSGKWKEETV